MYYIVLGCEGQLGRDLYNTLKKEMWVTGVSHDSFDIENLNDVKDFFELLSRCPAVAKYKQHMVVFNCMAYNDVRNSELEPEKALDVNAIGAYNLAKVLKPLDATLVHFSTDYVFYGTTFIPTGIRVKPFGYLSNDVTIEPLNKYGKSKYIGEQLIQSTLPFERYFIIRTSSLYGDNPTKIKGNFLRNIWEQYKNGKEIHVYDDLIMSPTYSEELANALYEMIPKALNEKIFGYYHIVNEGSCSWYEFAKEFFEQMEANDVKLEPKETKYGIDYFGPNNEHHIIRPYCTNLDVRSVNEKFLVNNKMSKWQDALRKYTTKLKEYEKSPKEAL